MAGKPRDPMRHNPGANPALAEPGWAPPGRRASPSPPDAQGALKSQIDSLFAQATREQAKADMAKRDIIDGLRKRTPGLEKAIALWERQSRELVGKASQIQAKLDWMKGGGDVGTGLTSPRYADKAQRAFDAKKILGEEGFMRGVAPSARSTAARGLSTAMGVAAAPIIDYALDPESRTPVQFARAQEEFITGLPGLVSPSELPPPAVLPPDRLKAVEATQGMVGVAPDTKSPNVTEQEVRAYISNKVAKGDKLPAWAQKITSMKGGRLSIKPVNPRTKARQEAAKSGVK